MHPASLVPRSGKDLVERLPEAECTVTNGDFRSDLQSPSFHIDEKFAPALRAFPNANLEADEFLLALRRSPNQHQHAFAVVFHPSLQEYTVGPHIQVSSRRQIPLLPMPVLALPLCRQTGNHRRRQVRCVLAQQRGQCLLEVPGRDATQIKHRQQRIQALRAPCPQRQNRRGEPDPLAVAGSPAIPNLHPGNLDSTDPRLDRAFGTMTVPDNTVSSISKPETLHLGKKCLGFQLDSLRQQLSRTRSQDIGQGIIDLVGVTKTNNIAILIHGVLLSLRGFWQARHPPRYAAYLTPSSPRFRLSSGDPALEATRQNTTAMLAIAETLKALSSPHSIDERIEIPADPLGMWKPAPEAVEAFAEKSLIEERDKQHERFYEGYMKSHEVADEIVRIQGAPVLDNQAIETNRRRLRLYDMQTAIAKDELGRVWSALRADIASKLNRRHLIAKGFRFPHVAGRAATEISTEEWQILDLNNETSDATQKGSNEVIYSGVALRMAD